MREREKKKRERREKERETEKRVICKVSVARFTGALELRTSTEL